MLNKIIDTISKSFTQWEIFVVKKDRRPLQFQSGACTMIKESETHGFAIRVIENGKIGFFASTSWKDTDEIVSRLKNNILFGKDAHFEFVKNSPLNNKIETYDLDIDNLSNEKIILQGQEVAHKIAEYNPDIDINVALEVEKSEISIINSSGLNLSEKKSIYSCVIEGTLSCEDEILNIYKSGASGSADLKIMDIAKEFMFLFEYSKKKARLGRDTSQLPVIFHPDAIDVLFLPLFHAFNGHNVYHRTSHLAGKEGMQEFSRSFTLIENPTINCATFSRNFDDEGNPCREKHLVNNGVINEFLYDLSTARKMNANTTGNGFRSNPASQNIFMEPTTGAMGFAVKEGTISNEDIVKNTKRGIIIHSLLGVGQGNVINGDFSNNVHVGFYIENGEIIGRVKDVMIAGNSFSCFKNIDCIGNTRLHEKESLSTPYMQFSNINVVS